MACASAVMRRCVSAGALDARAPLFRAGETESDASGSRRHALVSAGQACSSGGVGLLGPGPARPRAPLRGTAWRPRWRVLKCRWLWRRLCQAAAASCTYWYCTTVKFNGDPTLSCRCMCRHRPARQGAALSRPLGLRVQPITIHRLNDSCHSVGHTQKAAHRRSGKRLAVLVLRLQPAAAMESRSLAKVKRLCKRLVTGPYDEEFIAAMEKSLKQHTEASSQKPLPPNPRL